MLVAAVNTFHLDHWKLLYETYLYEDFLMDALAGRRINTNLGDQSSIYRVKSEREVNARLSESIPRSRLKELAESSVIAIKITDAIRFVSTIQNIYPQMRVVVVHREPIGVLNSLMAKGWFNSENEKKNLTWPVRVVDGCHVPFWVDVGYEKQWMELSALDRCAYYYLHITEAQVELRNKFLVNYDALLREPRTKVRALAEHLELGFGDKTSQFIESIRPTQRDRDLSILKKLSEQFSRINHYLI